MKLKDLTGKRFGRWLVLNREINNCRGKAMWKCRCDCGSIRIIPSGNLIHKLSVSCGCYRKENTHDMYYKGTKDISGNYFSSLRDRAPDRELEFDITIEYIQQLLEDQNYKCALSGLPICGSLNSTVKRCYTYSEQTASLDRIDSSKGYIMGNVQWVHKKINFMKQSLSDSEFIYFCNNVYANNKTSRVKKVYKYIKQEII